MRILLLSDVHIDAISCGKSRHDQIYEALLKAVKPKFDLMFFLGDWADPDNERSLRASTAAVKFAHHVYSLTKVKSVWITGNHDVAEDGHGSHVLSPLKETGVANVCDYPSLLSNISWPFQLVLLPYTDRLHAYDPGKFIEETVPALNKKKTTIILGHLDVEGATPGSEIKDIPRGREVFWPTAAIAKHMPHAMCIGGHIHERGVLKRDGVEINIVGSLDRLSFSEEKMTPGWHILEV